MLPLFPALALRVKRLRSFGIETAADVTRRSVKQVRGFGDHLTQAVIDWKASCERRFVFRPNEAVTPADRQAVMAKMAAKRHRLESALTVGATELQRFRLQAPARTMPLMEPLRQAAEKLAQAQADLPLLSQFSINETPLPPSVPARR